MRRLAYEASDCGLLSPDLAAGIRRVKGVKKIGVRLGNWLMPEQSQRLWNAPDSQMLKGKRDRALLRRTCARLCHAAGGELEQIQFLLGHVSIQTTERYLGCKQRIRSAVNDRIGIEPEG